MNAVLEILDTKQLRQKYKNTSKLVNQADVRYGHYRTCCNVLVTRRSCPVNEVLEILDAKQLRQKYKNTSKLQNQADVRYGHYCTCCIARNLNKHWKVITFNEICHSL